MPLNNSAKDEEIPQQVKRTRIRRAACKAYIEDDEDEDDSTAAAGGEPRKIHAPLKSNLGFMVIVAADYDDEEACGGIFLSTHRHYIIAYDKSIIHTSV